MRGAIRKRLTAVKSRFVLARVGDEVATEEPGHHLHHHDEQHHADAVRERECRRQVAERFLLADTLRQVSGPGFVRRLRGPEPGCRGVAAGKDAGREPRGEIDHRREQQHQTQGDDRYQQRQRDELASVAT